MNNFPSSLSYPMNLSLLDLALTEDLHYGDITSEPLALAIEKERGKEPYARASVVTREPCTLSGLRAAQALCHKVDTRLTLTPHQQAGDLLVAGMALATLEGPLVSMLKVERVMLNMLQHLCGIATTTQKFVAAVAGSDCRIAHTRKTTPGLRALELEAVVDGGGSAHRSSLASAAMIKDNHWQAAASAGLSAEALVMAIRKRISHTQTLTIEADTLAQAEQAVALGADVVLLDNFSLTDLRQAVDRFGSQVVLEASGGISLNTVAAVAETGVAVISTSQITLGAPAVDIGLDWLE